MFILAELWLPWQKKNPQEWCLDDPYSCVGDPCNTKLAKMTWSIKNIATMCRFSCLYSLNTENNWIYCYIFMTTLWINGWPWYTMINSFHHGRPCNADHGLTMACLFDRFIEYQFRTLTQQVMTVFYVD